MGNKVINNKNPSQQKYTIKSFSLFKENQNINIPKTFLSPSLFDFDCLIGKGGFGKVWKVTMKKTKKTYALKQISKVKIIDKRAEKLIKNERDILCLLSHPFIMNLLYCFQDRAYLYFIFDLLTGGDLRYHLIKFKSFSESLTKFYICSILLGIEYLHVNNIIHRDLKPENLILDDKGYLRITDFGIATIYNSQSINESSGTPGYMSPEVILQQRNSPVVDFFAIGVLTYEFMYGRRPYSSKNKYNLIETMANLNIEVNKENIPIGWNSEVSDFINKLLIKVPANRIGLRSFEEIKKHPWIRNYQWKDLYEKKIKPTFVPSKNKKGNYFKIDKHYHEDIGLETKERYQLILLNSTYFENFDYYDISKGEVYKNIIGKNLISIQIKNPHLNIMNPIKDEENKEDCGISKKLHHIKLQSFSSSNSKLKREYRMINAENEDVYDE